jgi:TPR repeat protein
LAEQGNMQAQFNVGNCYKDGLGVAEDKQKAAEWYAKAARQGSAEALNRVNDMKQE